MNKTYSQKIALAFSIVSSILLIPALFGLALSVYIWVLGIYVLIAGSFGGLVVIGIATLISISFGFGIYLLALYIGHYNGKLDKNRINRMWIKSAIFNGICSVISIFGFGHLIQNSFSSKSNDDFIIFLPLLIWWVVATFLAITANFSLEKTEIK